MSEPLRIPRELRADFDRFRVAFDRVTAQWVARGEEAESDMELLRARMREYIAMPHAESDGWSSRRERLEAVFGYWQALAREVAPDGVAVRPQLSIESESRMLDREWQRRRRV